MLGLNFNRPLRGHDVLRAVDMALEGHGLLGHLSKFRQGHDLEAARVREDRFLPTHKPMQAAKPSHPLCAGAQHEMIGIA